MEKGISDVFVFKIDFLVSKEIGCVSFALIALG